MSFVSPDEPSLPISLLAQQPNGHIEACDILKRKRMVPVMKWMRHPVTRIVLVLLALCVIIFCNILRAAYFVPPERLHPPTPSSSELTKAMANLFTFRSQWEIVGAERRYTQFRRHYVLRISDADFNVALKSQWYEQVKRTLPGDFPFRNMEIKFTDDVVSLSGLTDYRGRTVLVTVDGTLKISGPESLQFKPVTVHAGRWNPPGFIQRRALTELNARASKMSIPTPAPVTEVETETGWLTLKG